MASVRWDPIDVVPTDPAAEVAPAPTETEGSAPPAPEATAAPEGSPAADPDALGAPAVPPAETAPDGPPAPPDLGLVVPERLGELVAPVKVKMADTAMAFKVEAPTEPGRYRLTVTLHDDE